jgi:hypothetical protein
METMATPWTVFRETTRFHVPAKGGGRYDPAHIRIHKIVVGVGLAFGALGVLAALGFAAGSVIVALSAKNLESAAVTLIGIPVSFLIPPGCYFIGTSMALVFAPTRFLRGPIGQKWVKIAGVKSPILARLLFILIVVLVVGIVVAIVVTLMHLP